MQSCIPLCFSKLRQYSSERAQSYTLPVLAKIFKNFFLKFILKTFVKKTVVSDIPYKRNGQTAPQFIIKADKDFTAEKDRLINYIKKTKTLGASHFEEKESHSFGKLKVTEWNNMFYKHLDHHLTQFGVQVSMYKKSKYCNRASRKTGIIKDIAAGAVFIASIVAALIYMSKFLQKYFQFFSIDFAIQQVTLF